MDMVFTTSEMDLNLWEYVAKTISLKVSTPISIMRFNSEILRIVKKKVWVFCRRIMNTFLTVYSKTEYQMDSQFT